MTLIWHETAPCRWPIRVETAWDGSPPSASIFERSRRPGPLELLFVGNLSPVKGLDLLLESVSRLPHSVWRLTVAGSLTADPEHARRIRGWISSRGLGSQVRLLGVVDGEDLRDLYTAAQVFVMPFAHEGFGIAALEAMAFGLPVIGSTAGGVRRVRAACGKRLSGGARDHAAVCRHLEDLYRDRDRLAAMGRAALDTFSAHPTWDQSMRRGCAFLEKVANTAQGLLTQRIATVMDSIRRLTSSGSACEAETIPVRHSLRRGLLFSECAADHGGPPRFRMEWSSLLRVSPEASLPAARHVSAGSAGPRFRPVVYVALTAAVMFLKLFQSADRLVPMVFNRDFNLFLDTQRLPDLVLLFRLTRPPALVLTGLAGTLAGTAGLAWGVWRAFKTLHHGLSNGLPSHRPSACRRPPCRSRCLGRRSRRLAAGLWGEAVWPRVVEEVHFILNLENIREQHRSTIRQAAGRARHTAGDLRKLSGRRCF